MNTSNFAVEVTELVKKFGAFTAVNHVSFQVRPGEIFGFLGPNGAGKSTTIRMMCGILRPTGGAGQVGGFDIVKESMKIKEHIGYMSQKFSLYDDLTVEENINFYAGIYGVPDKRNRVNYILEKAEMNSFRKYVTRNLSGGWKQRLALACAIIHKPKIIFLDEPTSGVDPITRGNFWDIIKMLSGMGVTVFVTTHYMGEAEQCNRLAFIYKGTLVAMGTPAEMKTKYMENDIVEIEVNDPENTAEKLTKSSLVKDVALFGSNIHAVVHNAAEGVPKIESFFKSENIDGYRVKKIEPSLEDVFVSLVENYDSKKEAA
ncbi:MAG: ABC transporter ATP-binding protein [Candidatus Omnitrophota bacterium]